MAEYKKHIIETAMSIGDGSIFNKTTPDEFWQEKDIEQLAAEQGVSPIKKMEDVLGSGSSLWKDDEDFDSFIDLISRGHEHN